MMMRVEVNVTFGRDRKKYIFFWLGPENCLALDTLIAVGTFLMHLIYFDMRSEPTRNRTPPITGAGAVRKLHMVMILHEDFNRQSDPKTKDKVLGIQG